MPRGDLFPSVERRLKACHGLSDRAKPLVGKPAQPKPTITLTREFGCEAFPITGELGRPVEKKTGEPHTDHGPR